jgi:DNA-directed RNA polymerase specialized sigma24 family protein
VNKEVTPEKFAGFLAWLDPDTERAGDAYERLRFQLTTFFSRRQSLHPDELADETINRVILKCAEETIENKSAYCYGVAKNVYRESLRKERAQVDIDDVSIAAPLPEEPAFSDDCLDKCLAKLPPNNRELILEYFSEDKQQKIELHRRLSKSLATSQTALRMRVMRIKQTLTICVRECMT